MCFISIATSISINELLDVLSGRFCIKDLFLCFISITTRGTINELLDVILSGRFHINDLLRFFSDESTHRAVGTGLGDADGLRFAA